MNEAKISLRGLFNEAVELADAAERAAFLQQACGNNTDLRRRIEDLLQAHERAGGFLESPAQAIGANQHAAVSLPLTEKPGVRISRYKLLQQIGEGGCGVVYMAEQEEPVRRRVALKVIKLGMDTKSVIARFEAERQALALMDHPNIAKVFDAGATDTGRPYFVMELVRGIKVTDYCDQNNLTTRERLKLLIQVCQAIQHAHQKGIIHRDIKPSNILVTVSEPGSPGCPKVIDFGIAKATTDQRLTDKTVFTAFEQFLGTPAYMSPEQAMMTTLDVDTRTDIYALGVLLYELLTGQTPFDQKELLAAGLDEMRRTVREREPLKPSTRLTRELVAADARRLRSKSEEEIKASSRRLLEIKELIHLLRGDLDWIVMKCLEKDRTRRYETANGLAMDIERHLNDEPIVARPPSNLYRFQKLARRKRLTFAALGAVIVTLLIGLGGILWQWHRAEQHALGELNNRLLAEEHAAKVRLNLYAADVSLASRAIEHGDYGLARRTLAALKPRAGEEDLRGFEWRYLWKLCQGDQLATLTGHQWIVTCAAFSPGGKLVATGSQDATARIWDAERRQMVTTLNGTNEAVWSVAFSPDGGLLMTAGSGGEVKFWNTTTWQTVNHFPGQIAALSRTGSVVAVVSSSPFYHEPAGKPVLWDYRTGKKLKEFGKAGRALALSPDDRRLAVAADDSGIDLWDVSTGQLLRTLATEKPVWSLCFSLDGSQLLSAGWSEDALVWNLAGNQPSQKLHGHSLPVWLATFSPDGSAIATASSDQTIRLWDAATFSPRGVLRGHANEVWCVAFSPDGRLLATGGKDQNVMLWSASLSPKPNRLPNQTWTRPLFSPDGMRIMTATAANPDSASILWNVADCMQVYEVPQNRRAIGFSPDGSRVVTWNDDSTGLQFWPVKGGGSNSVALAAAGPEKDAFRSWGFSPEWETFFAIDRTGLVRFWETGSGKLLGTVQGPAPPIRAAILGTGGKYFAVSVERENIARLYERASAREMQLAGHRDYVSGLAFTRDGATLATGSLDGTIRLWDTATGRQTGDLPGHMQETTDVAFSPDGRTLASVCRTEEFKLWHLATRREVLSRKFPNASLGLQFSPDGRHLAVSTEENALELFDAPTLEELDQPVPVGGPTVPSK